MFYFDSYYIMLVVPAFLIAMWAQIRVKSTFNRYAKVENHRRMTGAQAAEAILRANGVNGVRIEHVRGTLSDHYDPRGNVIRLSDSVYQSSSVAAVGVAAHEAGHAVQYAVGYAPIKLRTAIIPACNYGSQLSMILLIIGLVLYSEPMFAMGIVLFSVAVFGQIVTLPVEFNASRRALAGLESGYLLSDDELRGAKKVLSAAALTYVAALLVSIAHLLRYVLIFAGRRRN